MSSNLVSSLVSETVSSRRVQCRIRTTIGTLTALTLDKEGGEADVLSSLGTLTQFWLFIRRKLLLFCHIAYAYYVDK